MHDRKGERADDRELEIGSPSADPLALLRSHFHWSSAAEQRVIDRMDQICEGCLYERFLQPVLASVWELEGGKTAWIAERIGVHKATTGRWPWPGRTPDDTSRGNKRGAKKQKRVVPTLRQFFLLLASFSLDPADDLPHGRDVAVEVWKRCIQFADHELFDNRAGCEIETFELYCLHVRQLMAGHSTLTLAGVDQNELIAQQVIASVERLTGRNALRGSEHVFEILKKWQWQYDTVAALICFRWDVE